mmetsp:Transcript_34760/g.76122  ORF Transcript_34760/g.76122 Transcript_34760/m.76122 type:complete len:121 (+) Transcript_34760:192-554(+)
MLPLTFLFERLCRQILAAWIPAWLEIDSSLFGLHRVTCFRGVPTAMVNLGWGIGSLSRDRIVLFARVLTEKPGWTSVWVLPMLPLSRAVVVSLFGAGLMFALLAHENQDEQPWLLPLQCH